MLLGEGSELMLTEKGQKRLVVSVLNSLQDLGL